MLGLGHSVSGDSVSLVEIFSNNFSILFDGTNDYIDLDSTLAPDIDPTKGTISAWVKIPTTVSSTMQILSCRRDSDNLIQLFYHAGSNQMRAVHKGNGTSITANVDAGETIENDDNWHFVAMTWDTSAGDVIIYQDGSTAKETSAGIQNFSGDAPDKCDMGKSSGGDSGYYKGYIDELSVFTEVVDIATLYNGGSPKDVEFSALTGLVGYYRFTEGTGTSAGDESGNGNTGTLTNGPTFNTSTPS